MRYVLSFALVATALPAAAQEISNFRSGLACLNPDAEVMDPDTSGICVDTDVIHITGQSVCVFDGKKFPCTWYGFEFDYRNASGTEQIMCKEKSTVAGTIGNPSGIDARDVTTFEYALKLTGKTGRYFNPQYSIFREGRKIAKEIVHETTCYGDNRKLFSFKFRLVFPATRGSVAQTGDD